MGINEEQILNAVWVDEEIRGTSRGFLLVTEKRIALYGLLANERTFTMLKGYIQDVTGYLHDPELFEVCGAKTKVYQVYVYEDTHRVHIADSSPSYELWFIGGQVIPEKYPLDEEKLEWMYDRENEYFQGDPPVEYINCRNVREPIALGEYYPEFQEAEPEEGEEPVSYMDQYAAHMEEVVDYAYSNDLKGEVLQKRGIV